MNWNIPTDVLENVILPFNEPSCEAVTKDSKLCSETWEFKTKSGKNVNCKHYCKQHINEWILDSLNSTYKVKIENEQYILKINNISIYGFFNTKSEFSFLNKFYLCITIIQDKFIIKILTSSSGKIEIGYGNIIELSQLLSQFYILKIEKSIISDSLTLSSEPDKNKLKIYRSEDDILSNKWTLYISTLFIPAPVKYKLRFEKIIYEVDYQILFQEQFLEYKNQIIDSLNTRITTTDIDERNFLIQIADTTTRELGIKIPINKLNDWIDYVYQNVDESLFEFNIV